MTDAKKSILYRSLFLGILVLVLYANTLNHGFVWDDKDIIVENTQLQSLGNIPSFFLSEDRIEGPTGYYRPVTYISFAVDRAVWGLNPLGFNLTNLVLHLLVSLVFYRLVAALFQREDLALVAALLFALHPIAGETVNFHSGGRNTLLSALFALLSMLSYLKGRRAAAVACFGVAILSKEFALLMPALFFLYDLRLSKEKIRWLRYLPYVVVTLIYLALRSIAVQGGGLLKTMRIGDALHYAPGIVAGYLKNMIFPFALKTMYDVRETGTATYVVCVVLMAALIGGAVYFRKRPEILFGVSMFVLFLLPVSNIFDLGATRMADRYAYFATFGCAIAAAYCICLAKRQAAAAIAAVLCLCFFAVGLHRNGFWKDDQAFFTQMAQDAPGLTIAFQNLGYLYFDRHDFANADRYLTAAYGKRGIAPSALIGSASMFLEMNQPEKALVALNKKIELEPYNPMSYIMASTIYHQTGNDALAAKYRDKAVALQPGIFEMMKGRVATVCSQGEAFMAKGNLVYAERLFHEALSIDPFCVPALIDMGTLSATQGALPEAARHLGKAAALEPRNPVPHYNLSLVYESQGRINEARAEMEKFQMLKGSAGMPAQGARQ